MFLILILFISLCTSSLLHEYKNVTGQPLQLLEPPMEFNEEWKPIEMKHLKSQMMGVVLSGETVELYAKDVLVNFDNTEDKDTVIQSFKVSLRNLVKEHKWMKMQLKRLMRRRKY